MSFGMLVGALGTRRCLNVTNNGPRRYVIERLTKANYSQLNTSLCHIKSAEIRTACQHPQTILFKQQQIAVILNQTRCFGKIVGPRILGNAKNKSAQPNQVKKKTVRPTRTNEEVLEDIEAKQIEPESGSFGCVGEEISGKSLTKEEILTNLNAFYRLEQARELALAHGISDKLFSKVFISFRKYCYKSTSLPPELHIKLCDIINGHSHSSDLFPYFLDHARQVFPHLECRDELKKISYLGYPHNWYPEARAKKRKVVFHAGPTNSGKTYNAMRQFLKAKSGLYCGPLKLLASEVFTKTNQQNVPCDLITGEERRLVHPDGATSSEHYSCTIEMVSTAREVEVAIIDEIQMLRDPGRGWAWTRALLGVPAEEVHVCGEVSAIELVRSILMATHDTFEVVHYDRLTPLVLEDKPLEKLSNIRPGDCLVCFSKDKIYKFTMRLEKEGHNVAVIYGTLPAGTKLKQCRKFNDGTDCNVMVATDAIGMGLNLSIGRIIFTSLIKIQSDNEGNRYNDYLTPSECKQIAGRAGRFNSPHSTGYVTTLKGEDMETLKEIFNQEVEPLKKACLQPTVDQIEMFAYHLPHLSMSNLIDLFMDLCDYDSSTYFMSDMETFKTLANQIETTPMSLRSRYTFCCSPINTKLPFVVSMFSKFARQFSNQEPVTTSWFKRHIEWPCKIPKTINELTKLEEMCDIFELYLWLSYRFPSSFPEPDEIRQMQIELDGIIANSLSKIMRVQRTIVGLEDKYAANR